MDIAGLHITHIGDDCILLEPSEGLDPTDPDTYLLPLLADLQKNNARYLIYDMKKVAIANPAYLGWLTIASRTLGVCGIQMIVVSLRPHTVFALSGSMVGEPAFLCALDVDSARQRARSEMSGLQGPPTEKSDATPDISTQSPEEISGSG